MYTLGRRSKISLVVPFVFLILMIIKLIAADLAYNKAVAAGKLVTSPVVDPYNLVFFLVKLVAIYILSVLFLSVETLVRIYITDKDSPQSVSGAQAIQAASWKDKFKVIRGIEVGMGSNMITHSVLFQLLIIVLCFYASTSSDSVLGKGLTLSIALQLIIDQAILLKNKQSLSSWFWQIKASFPLQVHQIYFAVASVLTILCIFFTLR